MLIVKYSVYYEVFKTKMAVLRYFVGEDHIKTQNKITNNIRLKFGFNVSIFVLLDCTESRSTFSIILYSQLREQYRLVGLVLYKKQIFAIC